MSPDDQNPAAEGGAPRAAVEDHVAALYTELRRTAHDFFRGERARHTLQPTALVHEVYLRLIRRFGAAPMSRAEFIVHASMEMRRVLIDHARKVRAEKRGGGQVHITLDESRAIAGKQEIDLLELNELLDRFERIDPDSVRLINLRFFGGATMEETAEIMGISKSKAEKDWKAARAWLAREMGPGEPSV